MSTAGQVEIEPVRCELGTPIAWQGGVLLPGNPPIVVDVATGSTGRLDLPDGLILLGAADRREGSLVLGDSPQDDLRLLVQREGGWSSCGLPFTAYDPRHTSTALAADGEKIVVLVDSLLQRFEKGKWTSVQLSAVAHPREGVLLSQPAHALLVGRRLYLGYDDGEWGGDLVAIDIDSGQRTEVQYGMLEWDLELPVTELLFDRAGRLWCLRATAHGGNINGSLYRRDGDLWALASHSCNYCEEESEEKPSRDWSLPPASFEAAAFDEAGTLYMAVAFLGLVRREPDGAWIRLTPDWEWEDYVDGLVVVGRTGWTKSGDRLLGIDLDDGSTRTVPLR